MQQLRPSPVLLFRSNLSDLPCPANISYMFAVGSLLGFFYSLQLVTGVTLAITYESVGAFIHSLEVSRDYNSGWVFRVIHANGASAIIFLLWLHVSRGLFIGSYKRVKPVWASGCVLLILIMLAAFSGYVLPWGQMSYWAATVILNLFSTIPLVGDYLVESMWGGPVVSSITVSRIFSVHFLVPFAIVPVILFHLTSLHGQGTSNPVGSCPPCGSKQVIHPLYSSIDYTFLCAALFFFSVLCLGYPDMFGMPENFQAPSPLSTPPHILPEWYFLPFYAVLRSVPQNTAGVILIAFFLLSLFYPILNGKSMNSISLLLLCVNSFLLLWLGGAPLELPFTYLALGHSITHFFIIFF